MKTRDNSRIPSFIDKEFLHYIFDYDPETGGLIRRKNGKRVGYLSTAGYPTTKVNGTVIFVHWIVWMIHHGKWPTDQLDHINRIRDDSRIENLRESDVKLNHLNWSVIKTNTSGYTGVTRYRGRWAAQIMIDKKGRFLGTFDTPEEASEVYQQAKQKRLQELLNGKQ